MRRKLITVMVAAAAGASGIWVWALSAHAGTVNSFAVPVRTGRPAGVPAWDFIGNSKVSPNRIPSRIVVRVRNLHATPGSTGSPFISGEQALAYAWQQLGPDAHPTSATATLETVDNQTIWVVTYQGVCSPNVAIGGAPQPGIPWVAPPSPSCAPLAIVLDAETGAFVDAS